MPTEHEWEDEQPVSEEDAVKRMMKRQVVLNGTGVVGDLWRMHQACHDAIEKGDDSHLPMDFVRYEGKEPEVKDELFYICKGCLSDYIQKHPERTEKFVILRGNITKEASLATKEWAQKENDKMHAAEQAKYEESQKKPCPVCGKTLKDHTEDEFKRCAQQYSEANPFDEDGGTNKP